MSKILRCFMGLVVILGTAFSLAATESADGMLKKAAGAINGSMGLIALFFMDFVWKKISVT